MLCVFMVEGMSVGVNVMLSLMSVISPPPDLCGMSARTVVYVGNLGVLDLEVSLVWNCDDVCMRVFDESFELNEFVVYAVYVNLQNDEISLIITARFMNACGVCSVCSPNCPSLVRIWNNPVSVLRLCG